MKYATEQNILKIIKNAVQEEVKQINSELIELRKLAYTLPQKERENKKLTSDNQTLSNFLLNYRNLLSRIEMTPFDKIEKIEHQECHVNEYGEWWWFYEMGYKVITEWEEDEIFILEHWNL